MAKFLYIALFLFLIPSLVFAAGDHGESPGLLTVNPGLGFWTVITFLLLMFVLRKFAWGPILENLGERESTIENALESAKKAEETAKDLLNQYEQKLADAEAQVKAIVEEGRQKAQKNTDQMLKDATDECQRLRETTKKELQVAKKQAVKELFRLSAELSVAISSKIIDKTLQEDDHKKIIEKTIDDFKGVELEKYVN